jgi:hypothetical protein
MFTSVFVGKTHPVDQPFRDQRWLSLAFHKLCMFPTQYIYVASLILMISKKRNAALTDWALW